MTELKFTVEGVTLMDYWHKKMLDDEIVRIKLNAGPSTGIVEKHMDRNFRVMSVTPMSIGGSAPTCSACGRPDPTRAEIKTEVLVVEADSR